MLRAESKKASSFSMLMVMNEFGSKSVCDVWPLRDPSHDCSKLINIKTPIRLLIIPNTDFTENKLVNCFMINKRILGMI